jgi:predicted nucleic acid-binding protein
MNCYLDSSALVKRYLEEPGSSEVARLLQEAKRRGTVAISRAEVIAGFAKAIRVGTVKREVAEAARHAFQADWPRLARFRVTDLLIHLSCELVWTFGLRGYDSVQLAAASMWLGAVPEPVVMVTFDVNLWEAAASIGLDPYPSDVRLLKG